ncbi:hypothetical protein [Paracoccus litorisediminis]|uniref:Uncharacterized protein n=1 Tax=Paracoccus litorisediminis TaxID=2006130 RepID=A0A844HSF2_9RHOB|nr:hypothetical protein [Paracoccus litorisediminis]MTH61135.1 hypothetical protein [Paracoccus litorisediminis]
MTFYVTHLNMDDEPVLEEEFATEELAQERYLTARASEEYPRYTVNAAKADATYPLLCPSSDIEEPEITLDVTVQERDMLIAALRLWQEQDEVSAELVEIAENGRGHGGMLADWRIDDLIENTLNK